MIDWNDYVKSILIEHFRVGQEDAFLRCMSVRTETIVTFFVCFAFEEAGEPPALMYPLAVDWLKTPTNKQGNCKGGGGL